METINTKELRGEFAFKLMESSPFMVFWVHSSGYFAYTNAATREALGYTVKEIRQLKASDVLANYDSGEREKLREEIADREDGLLRAALIRKDKSTFLVESSNHLFELKGETINCAICWEVSPAGDLQVGNVYGDQTGSTSLDDMRSLYDMADDLNIIGSSKQIRTVLLYARRFARRRELPVLITGETGVGKESMARFIHKNGPRASKNFVCVNCASFVENDMISRLFGHVKGAFTGAVKDRKGIFESASEGTLFLDEVGELSLIAQKQLLRVLQSGSYYRMGDDRERRTDVRIIAATNQNLPKMIRDGTFREDLYFRLCVLNLHLPPLRERISDIPQLVKYKLIQINEDTNTNLEMPERKCLKLLMSHVYPGNIRELFNLIDRASILNKGKTLKIKPEYFITNGFSTSETDSLLSFPTLAEIQTRHILKALNRCRGKISGKGGAAELLGVNHNTLRARMSKFGIQRPKSME